MPAKNSQVIMILNLGGSGHVGSITYNRIPKPRSLGSQLLKKIGVTLPEAIPSRGIAVSTRKNLDLKRKNHQKK